MGFRKECALETATTFFQLNSDIAPFFHRFFFRSFLFVFKAVFFPCRLDSMRSGVSLLESCSQETHCTFILMELEMKSSFFLSFFKCFFIFLSIDWRKVFNDDERKLIRIEYHLFQSVSNQFERNAAWNGILCFLCVFCC